MIIIIIIAIIWCRNNSEAFGMLSQKLHCTPASRLQQAEGRIKFIWGQRCEKKQLRQHDSLVLRQTVLQAPPCFACQSVLEQDTKSLRLQGHCSVDDPEKKETCYHITVTLIVMQNKLTWCEAVARWRLCHTGSASYSLIMILYKIKNLIWHPIRDQIWQKKYENVWCGVRCIFESSPACNGQMVGKHWTNTFTLNFTSMAIPTFRFTWAARFCADGGNQSKHSEDTQTQCRSDEDWDLNPQHSSCMWHYWAF